MCSFTGTVLENKEQKSIHVHLQCKAYRGNSQRETHEQPANFLTRCNNSVLCLSSHARPSHQWTHVSASEYTLLQQIAKEWSTACFTPGEPGLDNTLTTGARVMPSLVVPAESWATHHACMKQTQCPSSGAKRPFWCELFPKLDSAPHSQEEEREMNSYHKDDWGLLKVEQRQ